MDGYFTGPIKDWRIRLSPRPTDFSPHVDVRMAGPWAGTLLDVRDHDGSQYRVTIDGDGNVHGASVVKDADGRVVTGPLQVGDWYRVEVWLEKRPVHARYGIDLPSEHLSIETPRWDAYMRSHR